MPTTLLYQPTKTRLEGTVEGIFGASTITLELDANVSEGFQGDVAITEHPVETGANITDHARLNSEKVTIEGIISNTPLDGDPEAGRAEGAFGDLIELKNARQIMTVFTPRRTYRNMVLESLTSTQTAQTGDALHFTATFKQIQLAEVAVKIVQVQAEPKANDKTKLGTQVGKTASDEDVSSLKQGASSLGVKVPKPPAVSSHGFNTAVAR